MQGKTEFEAFKEMMETNGTKTGDSVDVSTTDRIFSIVSVSSQNARI